MKVTGIIAEYDPFHLGHHYLLETARERTGADALVVIMSGSFVQRGAPAFFNKGLRTAMAIEGGADLVIELPYIYAGSSSHDFAAGGAAVLNGLGIADHIAFGCEFDDADILKATAEASKMIDDDDNAKCLIKEKLDQGISYPEAVTRTVREVYGTSFEEILRSPNNLLGIEYIKALNRLDSSIEPLPVLRKGMAHNSDIPGDGSEVFLSGSVLRAMLADGRLRDASGAFTNDAMERLLEGKYTGGAIARNHRLAQQKLFELLSYRILTMDASKLSRIYGVDEGLENKIIRETPLATDLDNLLDRIKSKRYTRARLSRMLMHILVNVEREEVMQLKGTAYARVLGFSPAGGKVLRQLTKTSDIPVLSNLSGLSKLSTNVQRSMEIDMRSTDIRNILYGSRAGSDRKYVPYRSEE